jgi:hypothetical protein
MKTLYALALFALFFAASPSISAQVTFNSCAGVTVTATTSSGMSGQPDCASISAVLLPGGWTSTSASGFVRYNWASAISSVRIEFFSVNTNDYATISTNTGGTLTVTSVGGCSPVSGVVVGPYTGPSAFGTTAYNVSSTNPFTQLNFVNTGGQSGWVCDCPVNVILAVELDYFQAQYNADEAKVRLDWQTANESNSSHFMVERSADGSNWEALGNVSAAGNSSQSLNYAYEDPLPLSGKSMYRLHQVDTDGSYKISGAQSVFVDDYLKAYPTIADQTVHITGLKDATNVQLFDKLGKAFTCPSTQESNGFAFNTALLESGFYILRIPTEGTVVTRKIWVKH